MKKSNKILSFALSCVLSIGLLAGCGTSDDKEGNQQGSNGDEPKEKVTLTMGTSADYPPYEFIDTAVSDEPIGFDIDIANYIADKLDFELKVQDMDFNGLIGALSSGRIDFVLAGMTPTEERKQNVDFSDIYYVAAQTIVSKSENGITSLDQLAGKKLGVQLGSIQVELAEAIAEEVDGVQIEYRNKISDLIQELKSNRIDAAIIEDKVAEGHLAANSELSLFVVEEEGEVGSAIAFPKESELVSKFNEVLEEMKQNGELEKLIEKWFRNE